MLDSNPIAEMAALMPLFFAALTFIFSALIGSFLNVVIYRLPIMMQRSYEQELAEFNNQPIPQFERFNLLTPNSHCPSCQTQIKPWHNLPILGWFILGGKCASCRTPYSIRYALIEFFTAALSTFTLIWFDYSYFGMAAMVFTWLLICLTFIDFDNYILPDSLNYLLLWGGLLVQLVLFPENLSSAVIGAMAGYLSLWLVYWGFKLLTGKEGMGYGDFKLLAALGGWLGWQMLPLIILLSSLVGAILGILLITLRKHDSQKPIPFGPYLAIAGYIALIFGNDIIHAYLKLIHV